MGEKESGNYLIQRYQTSHYCRTYPVANLIRGELLHGTPAEGLPFPLGREKFQLFALFIGQRMAISHLHRGGLGRNGENWKTNQTKTIRSNIYFYTVLFVCLMLARCCCWGGCWCTPLWVYLFIQYNAKRSGAVLRKNQPAKTGQLYWDTGISLDDDLECILSLFQRIKEVTICIASYL